MSQENVEVVRRSLDASTVATSKPLSRTLIPMSKPSTDPRVPGGGRVGLGEAEVKRYFESMGRYWESVRVVPEHIVDLGDQVLVLGRMTARSRRGGPEIERPLDQMFTLRDGKIVRNRTFSTRADALKPRGCRGRPTP
jgi:ketosteroid isomerase-like protein